LKVDFVMLKFVILK